MIKNTFIALIHDILKILQENRNFFELDEQAKTELIKKTGLLPEEISTHVSSMSQEELIKDIKEVLSFASSRNELIKLNSGLAKAFANFCVNQIPTHLDNYQPNNKPLFKGAFGQHLAVFYSSGIEKQIIEQIQSFVSLVYSAPFVVVQTPIQITKEQKTTIRSELNRKYKHSIPSFSVNKKLIGGLRVFVDGKTHDHSWISQINKLTSLTNK